MKTLYLILGFAAVSGLFSCAQYGYYQSPSHTQLNAYRAMPLQSDSLPFSMHVSGSFSQGAANQNSKDNLYYFQGGFHNTHQTKDLQFAYGLNAGMGSYKVTPYSIDPNNIPYNYYLNYTYINSVAGRKSFSTWGGFAAVNFVKSFPKGGEWRIIGAEWNWQRESGNYLDFRRKLDFNDANLNDKNREFSTLSLSTELLGKMKNGSYGYKVSYGTALRTIMQYDEDGNGRKVLPGSLSQTFHLTQDRFTGYAQLNTGFYAYNVRFGINYRILR